MTNLFSPLTIGKVTFRNRIVVSPMCMYSSEDGYANDWHLVHLGSRAVGGAALVIAEATAVSPEGRITPGDLGIWKDDHISFLNRITTFIEKQGAVPGIQLAHAGRKASHQIPWQGGQLLSKEQGQWETSAPSAIPFMEGNISPKALDEKGIEKVIADFKAAAARALAAGFKVLEIHSAHGYLLHEFLSPLSNKRTDRYGGSFENRTRFVTQIAEGVRSVMPDGYPLFIRISATDWTNDGWSADESVALAQLLKEKGVDLIDCSSGGILPKIHIPSDPGYQVPFAEKIRKEATILTGAVGRITTAKQAEEIISGGKADMVFLAREFLRDPYFPMHAASELGVDVVWPSQYERAK